jgi:hypothetical protein
VGAESDYWKEVLKVTRTYWREMISPIAPCRSLMTGILNFLSWRKHRFDMLTSFSWTRRRTLIFATRTWRPNR